MTDESRVRGSQEVVAAYTIENIDTGPLLRTLAANFIIWHFQQLLLGFLYSFSGSFWKGSEF